jgi:hypothetical protein
MTSLSRKMKRARFKRAGNKWPTREQPFRVHRGANHEILGGYDVLHPTKGWRRICGERVRAGARMAALLGA